MINDLLLMLASFSSRIASGEFIESKKTGLAALLNLTKNGVVFAPCP